MSQHEDRYTELLDMRGDTTITVSVSSLPILQGLVRERMRTIYEKATTPGADLTPEYQALAAINIQLKDAIKKFDPLWRRLEFISLLAKVAR